MIESMGHAIKALREEAGITQVRLAELLGVSQSAISRIEYDLMPAYPYVRKLREIFGKDLVMAVDQPQQLHQMIKDAEGDLRRLIRLVRDRLTSLEGQLRYDRMLNHLGELQQLGPQLDAAVAVLATLHRVRNLNAIGEKNEAQM